MRKTSVKYTREVLEALVLTSGSYAQVLKGLDLKQTGGNHRSLTKYIKLYEIDCTHFKGCGWSKGQTRSTNSSVKAVASKIRISDELVFRENSFFTPSKLRGRLLSIGWPNQCSICGLAEWLGRPLTLHVDHINGNHVDHRLSNLRFICPNCHQQTNTWGAKNRNSKEPVISLGVKLSSKSKVTNLHNNCVLLTTESNISSRKVTRPACEELQELLWSIPTMQIAKLYGVSDTAVAKWARAYNLTKPPRGYWAKFNSSRIS
jgi:5-methylcytosine-specific restriction endonuclease McrA